LPIPGSTPLRRAAQFIISNIGRKDMAAAGLVVTLAGFLIAVASVGVASATSVRLIMVLIGIAVSLGGIMGLINPAYQKNAIWKR